MLSLVKEDFFLNSNFESPKTYKIGKKLRNFGVKNVLKVLKA